MRRLSQVPCELGVHSWRLLRCDGLEPVTIAGIGQVPRWHVQKRCRRCGWHRAYITVKLRRLRVSAR